jgi:spore coat protein U-like protein
MSLAVRSTILALIAAVASVVPAGAVTLTSTLAVRVVVQPACTVSGGTLDFGNYTSSPKF